MKLIKHPHDFKVLELRISEDANSSHFIYLKEHAVREHTEDKPPGRTLFVVNIPPYIDEKGLAGAFNEAGNIVSIKFSLKPSNCTDLPKKFINISKPSFKIAYIVFEKVAELDKALKLKTLMPVNSKNYHISCGIKKWMQDYNNSVLTTKSLKQKVEEFMSIYDIEVKKADEKEKELENEDNEGWVTVTKKGKMQGFARTEKMENKIMAKEEKGRKRKELKNFYTFQIRESKMKHIVALRNKFEEDKKKIAQIKQSRRFKPF